MKTGYTLPVFATAAASAAIKHLQHQTIGKSVSINLINPPQTVNIPIEQVAKIGENQALAITRSDPGEHLDITRDTPIWALVEIYPQQPNLPRLTVQGGEGVGWLQDNPKQSAIYSYAKDLLNINLSKILSAKLSASITIILPEGKELAKRTSNAAFGVMEGLSLLGTTGIVQPLTAQSQLDALQKELKHKAKQDKNLIFCIGENGLDLAIKQGFPAKKLIKTANWLGSMLVQAALLDLESVLLFGYHGKLIKLAGGIFHTHHHLADARLEILTAYGTQIDLPLTILQQLFNCPTTEAAWQLLRLKDRENGTDWATKLYTKIAEAIDNRTQDYIYKHSARQILIASILFDRQRQIIVESQNSLALRNKLC